MTNTNQAELAMPTNATNNGAVLAMDAMKQKHEPIVYLISALASSGQDLVEIGGYFEALWHFRKLDGTDARRRTDDARKAIAKASTAFDAYETAMSESRADKQRLPVIDKAAELTKSSEAEDSYLKVCPRGFSNEIIFFRVKKEELAEVSVYFEDYEDENNGRFTTFVHKPIGCSIIDWSDRQHFGWF
ncbi:hypothetical protein V1282_003542 [Nitrobacteraceae bacterium AZCC 2146]